MNELHAMEVLKNKHIPNIYLRSSRQDRLELLAGLIDTDGHRSGETFFFTQKDDRLTENVIFLCKSLGFRVTNHKRPNATSELVKYAEGEVNHLTIGGNTWEIPTRLPRKQATSKGKARDWLNYGINVTPIGMGTYYGFTLKEEPHFMLGDFTVTHNTTAGRVEMAEQLLQMKIITTAQEYLNVINTGNLDLLTEDTQAQLYLIKAENERFIDGQPNIALVTDEHELHIKEHSAVLSDPEMRFNPQLVQAVTGHITEHMNLLRGMKATPTGNQADPDYLKIMGEQPLAPIGGSPANQPNQGPPASSMNGQVQNAMGGQQVNSQLNPSTMAPNVKIPQPAKPPMVNGAPLPQTPQQQMMMMNGK